MNLSRKGRTALHIAAEFANTTDILEYPSECQTKSFEYVHDRFQTHGLRLWMC